MSCPTMVQVTNISPQASSQQMTELFSYLGDISSLKLFPEDDSKSVPSKVCFVDFKDENSAGTALHLTNTIFIDRALVISRSRYASIPVEEDAMSLAAPAVAIAANQTMSLGHTAPLLPTPTPAPLAVAPNNAGLGLAGPAPAVSTSMHMTPPTLPTQSPLISMMGTVVPPAPPLTGNVDPSKIEEIRRTVYVGNLNSSQITADQVLNFFLPCGEIKYVRMAGDETQPTRFVFVEFARPESVPIALQYNGAMFGDRPIKVNHSKNAIVKPQGPSAQETQREVDEAMKKVKEATLAISASIIPDTPKSKRSPPSRSRSRSRSHDYRRHRSRSRSKDRYRRRSRSRSPFYSRGYRGNRRDYYSPSPPRRRRYSRSRSPRRRSRSPRRYSRSPRRYSRSPRRFSRSPVRRRSRSPMRRRSRSPRRRSRSPRRYRSRTPPRRRRERSHSRSRSPPSSREERKRKRGSSREKGASHKRTKRSRSPSSSKKSSHKKDRRRRSGSGSPGREAGSPERVSSSRTKKKKRHHRHKKHSPSPSPIASPSPSPPPTTRRAKNDDDDDDNSSVTSKESVKSEQSSKGSPQRYSGREDSEMEEEEKLAGSRSSGSPSPTRNEMDSDSSYD